MKSQFNILALGLEGSEYSRNSCLDGCRREGERAQVWRSDDIRHIMGTC